MKKNNKIPHWFKLENAAKIFPPTSSKTDTKVFRFACELKEAIDKSTLEIAVNQALERFPFYTSILKRGVFWYYFEESDLKPIIEEENTPICSSIYNKKEKSLLFRVSYYRKRINLEVYHALTDGTGALQFLKTIVYHYLILKYPDDFKKLPLLDYDASQSEKSDDSFQKYYRKPKQNKIDGKSAYKIKGPKISEHRLRVIEGIMSVKGITKIAHDYNTTVTVFLAAILVKSIQDTMKLRDLAHPIVLTIPVNLRKYFPSESARNFFGIMNSSIKYDKDNNDIENIIKLMSKQFKKELTKEQLEIRMNSLSSLEHNIFARAVPLFIKDVALNIANRIAEKDITAALSNVGIVSMPKEMVPYIKLFDIFSSTNSLQACMCSFEDNLVISFTSPFISTDIQKHFFRYLTSMGLEIGIVTNSVEEL